MKKINEIWELSKKLWKDRHRRDDAEYTWLYENPVNDSEGVSLVYGKLLPTI